MQVLMCLCSRAPIQRVMCAQEFEKLVEKVVEYQPPEESGVGRINILLMGGVGAGKSSFTSSVDSVFNQRISRYETTLMLVSSHIA